MTAPAAVTYEARRALDHLDERLTRLGDMLMRAADNFESDPVDAQATVRRVARILCASAPLPPLALSEAVAA